MEKIKLSELTVREKSIIKTSLWSHINDLRRISQIDAGNSKDEIMERIFEVEELFKKI